MPESPTQTPEIFDDAANLPAVVALLARGRVGRCRVTPYRGSGYEMDFGCLGGKRLRLYRRTATEAYRLIIRTNKEIKEHGQFARALSTAHRYQAAECIAKLEPLGVALRDVVEDFLKRHPLGGRGRAFATVVAEVVEKKKAGDRSPTYVQDLAWKLKTFETAYPGRHIAGHTTEEVEAFLASHKWSPVTQRSFVQALNVVFNYAVKRGYRLDNPCEKLELPRVIRKEPVIFTVEQVQQAMALTLTTPDLLECLPYVAIGTFAGVRPQEIERLDWRQVSFESKTITILAPDAKNRSRRVVDMSPNLIAWLAPIAQRDGDVFPYLIRNGRSRMRRAMGLAKWPHDVMRHSFGSYHFAKHRSEHETVFQMGHGKDTDVFFSHYRALVQPEAADAFWNIFPPASHKVAVAAAA